MISDISIFLAFNSRLLLPFIIWGSVCTSSHGMQCEAEAVYEQGAWEWLLLL